MRRQPDGPSSADSHRGSTPKGDSAALQAVVFDFDGVIVESADIKTQAFAALFADLPEHRDAILCHHLDNLGISRFEKFAWIYRELLGREISPAESESLGRRFSALVMEATISCPFVPGALETLTALQGRFPAFVASGTPDQELQEIVDRRGLRPFFKSVHGSPATKEWILGRLIEELQLPPENLLMVGDGRSDLEAARAAGVAFLGRRRPEEAGIWRDQGVAVVDDLFGLSRWLGLPVDGGTRPEDRNSMSGSRRRDPT